jgi:hypothetical protein
MREFLLLAYKSTRFRALLQQTMALRILLCRIKEVGSVNKAEKVVAKSLKTRVFISPDCSQGNVDSTL